MKLGEAVYKDQQKDPSAKPGDSETKKESKDHKNTCFIISRYYKTYCDGLEKDNL